MLIPQHPLTPPNLSLFLSNRLKRKKKSGGSARLREIIFFSLYSLKSADSTYSPFRSHPPEHYNSIGTSQEKICYLKIKIIGVRGGMLFKFCFPINLEDNLYRGGNIYIGPTLGFCCLEASLYFDDETVLSSVSIRRTQALI